MELSNWAPEHSGALQEYLALGMSYSEIARAINAKFSTHYSRTATIGRAKRIGLGGAERPRNLAPLPPEDQQLSSRLLRQRFAAMSKWLVPEFERVETPELRCVNIEPRHLSLLELWGRRLPQPLWRRRGWRGHYLLRPREAGGFQLLHGAFSPDARAQRDAATRRRRGAAANRGGGISPAVVVMINRMKPSSGFQESVR
jgi:GcrA cell cycle regulator